MADVAHYPNDEEPEGDSGVLDTLKALGPGIISGASDNDPTTVATVSIIGSTTGYRLSWLLILLYPMLTTVQVVSARIGAVTQRGLQRDVAQLYGRGWGLLLLVSVLSVNILTVAADLGGGAAALGLMFHLDYRWFVVPFAVAVLVMLAFGSYSMVQRVLRWVLLVFVAYVFSAFAAHPDWGAVLRDTVLPKISLDSTYIRGALALLGTTLTGYVYVWETIEESEERPPIGKLGLAQADAGIGMLLAVAIFWFILIGTGATLGLHHHQVQTAQDAAQALVPVAGPIAAYLFAAGLLASAILAVPVLASTSAYVITRELDREGSLAQTVTQARLFYAVLSMMLLVGVVISLIGITPIQLLYLSSIVGGLGTPISMAFLLLVGRNRELMGTHAIGRLLQAAGWSTVAAVSAISVYFLWEQFG